MYARKIAEIAGPQQRAAFAGARLAEQSADINLLRLASELVVDAVVEPAGLRHSAGPIECYLRGGCLWQTI